MTLAALIVGSSFAAVRDSQPNLVVIVSDDLGWANIGYHGSPIRTPNIDLLATEGVELDRFYVCAVCSPTRAGLMTGRYPNRFGMQGAPTQHPNNKGLPPDEDTMAEMLARAGYKHRAAIGKWHLGTAATVFHPIDQGFSEFYGHYCGMINYYTHHRGGQLDWHRNYEACYDQGYSTDLVAREAASFIGRVPTGEPFFLYLAFNAPHTPSQAPEADIAAYENVDLGGLKPTHAAKITVMDRGIGKVLEALEEKGVTHNTLVLYLNDNGGVGGNGPLRGRKGKRYEGGVRVPAAIRWPARIPGGRKVDAVMGYVDVLPTLAAAAGYDYKPPRPLDGINLLDIICGTQPAPDRPFYVDRGTVVMQRWKLVHGEELYAIAQDPFEKTDLAQQRPEVFERLAKHLEHFESLTGPAYYPPGMPKTKSETPHEWKMPVVHP